MARRQRLAAQAAAASLRTSTPYVPEISDNEMVDGPPSDAATPREEEDGGEGDQDDVEAEEPDDRPMTPNGDSEAPSRSGTPRRAGRSTSLLPRKRRLGRPPRHKNFGSDEDRNEGPSDIGTPKRRGGFRGHRGGRWAKRGGGGPSHVTQVPIDKEGNMMAVVNDEVDMPEDLEGEKKVDKFGYLQDRREYRVRTFTILGRGRRLYMLSTEPARCIGFRDSYLFFQKHRLLYKIIIDDEEKRDLIERDLIPHSYKGRAIGVVTARSVFREFGAKIVIGGKKVVDDYAVQAAFARGDVEGELAVPDDRVPPPGEPYNRNQYVAWHGASAVYHSGAPSVPLPSGKVVDGKKRKITVTSDNWMLEHAREASRYSSTLAATRQENKQGLYDIHTNTIQWPQNMQPTHARWEAVNSEGADGRPTSQSRLVNGTKEGKDDTDEELSSIFKRLDPVYSRNFMIQDLYLETAPDSKPGSPGLDHEPPDFCNLSSDILDELPQDCRQAYEEAKKREQSWRRQWSTENRNGMRGKFLPTVEWFP